MSAVIVKQQILQWYTLSVVLEFNIYTRVTHSTLKETALTTQDSWSVRLLQVTRQNQISRKLNPGPESSLIIFQSAALCAVSLLCIRPVWRANGRISRSYRPCELTDELTGSDASFINKERLRLHWGQHLEPRHTRTHRHTHCITRFSIISKLNFTTVNSFLYCFHSGDMLVCLCRELHHVSHNDSGSFMSYVTAALNTHKQTNKQEVVPPKKLQIRQQSDSHEFLITEQPGGQAVQAFNHNMSDHV